MSMTDTCVHVDLDLVHDVQLYNQQKSAHQYRDALIW